MSPRGHDRGQPHRDHEFWAFWWRSAVMIAGSAVGGRLEIRDHELAHPQHRLQLPGCPLRIRVAEQLAEPVRDNPP